jgi:hypothetical protein
MPGTGPFISGLVGELRMCKKGFSGMVYATRGCDASASLHHDIPN